MPSLNDYLVLSGILFSIGTAGVFLRRNLITILLSIEIMLNAGEPDVRRLRPRARHRRRTDHRVLRHDRGGGGGRGRPGDRDRAVPAPRVAQPRYVHGAQVVAVMLLLIPLLPFVGFLVNASFGRRLKPAVSGLVAVAAMVASFAVSLDGGVSAPSLTPGRPRRSSSRSSPGLRPATSPPASRCGSIRCRR